MKSKIKYREEWLYEGVKELTPLFSNLNKKIPDNLRVSCGFPSRNPFGSGRRVIGECWNPLASADGSHEVFISPTIADSLEVLATLVHELVHATVGTEAKHTGMFKVVAVALGLEGKMTATVAGPRLTPELQDIHKKLKDYPHTPLNKIVKVKKESSIVKIECGCGYRFSISKKVVEEFGLPPECVCGEPFSNEEQE